MNVYLGIGGNLGNREENLELALKALAKQAGRLVTISPVYETEPSGFVSDNKFLNMVVVVETELSPSELLGIIGKIEHDLGRKREKEKIISRTMDIDILFYENRIIENTELIIPHPRMHERKFVLVPFCDIAPDFIHPVLHLSIREILETSHDKGIVKKLL